MRCTGCGRPLRPRAVPAAAAPGTIVVHTASRCKTCVRHGGRCGLPRTLTDEELVEDVEWIVDWDTPPSVAARVGYGTIDGLVGRLRRVGRTDLVERLLAGQRRPA